MRIGRPFSTSANSVLRPVQEPLAAAAQSAESAAAAAIDALEASRQRWEAELQLARDLAERLEMAAQEMRHCFSAVDASADLEGSISMDASRRSSIDAKPSARDMRSSSSTDTWDAASSPVKARRRPATGPRPQTLSASPYPALSGNAKSLAARAATPNNSALFLGKHSNRWTRANPAWCFTRKGTLTVESDFRYRRALNHSGGAAGRASLSSTVCR